MKNIDSLCALNNKDFSKDPMWQQIVDDVFDKKRLIERIPHTTSCFVAGTLVHTNKGLVPIEQLKVGDMVLSMPENGEGEPSYKPVVNTFVHENKELWLVVAEKHWSDEDIHGKFIDSKIYRRTAEKSEFIATPNHPVWVVGMGKMGDMNLDEIVPYPQPHWKRVDQLQQYEIVVNKDGVLFYIEQAQPLYHIEISSPPPYDVDHDKHMKLKPSCAWYQQDYYVTEEYEDYEDYDLKVGRVIDIENYYVTNRTGLYVKDTKGGVTHYNLSRDRQEQYIPFTDMVYNLVVADDHTYFVTKAGIWVHNTNCTASVSGTIDQIRKDGKLESELLEFKDGDTYGTHFDSNLN